MDNITIHAEHVTLNLHPASAGTTLSEIAATEAIAGTLIERPTLSETALAAGIRFTKVFADGTHGEHGDTRTDHVAVIDHAHGLMWSVESLGDPDNADDGVAHDQCAELCRDLRVLAHTDWRMPTRTELASLIDDTRHEPAIDTNFFTRVKPRWHWTSTPCAWSSASAWGVDFCYGYVYVNRRGSDGFALAVRRVGQ